MDAPGEVARPLRLFVGLPAPAPAVDALSSALRRWQSSHPALAWDEAEALHLTLQFLGGFPAARLPELAAALGAIAWPAFPLRVAGLGAFPDRHRPRLIWAGVESSPALERLAQAVAAATRPLDIAPEPRPFTPHISLARARAPRDARGLAFDPRQPRWGEGRAAAFHLYESVPTPVSRAARYRVLHTFPAQG